MVAELLRDHGAQSRDPPREPGGRRGGTFRSRYGEHVGRMLELTGESHRAAAKHARTVMRIETALARGSMPVVERRDPYKVYHRIDREGLGREAPVFPWNVYFVELGYPGITAI